MKEYSIWVTTDCNLACSYCYEGHDKKKLYIDHNLADRIIDFIASEESYNKEEIAIDFHGGEPFLNIAIMKYFVQELAYVLNNKIHFGATTNATILNDDILEFIRTELEDVTVSLDGTKNTHDSCRCFSNGMGSYNMAINNSMVINENTKNLRVRMTVTSDYVHTLARDIMHLVDNGFKCIVPAIDLFDSGWDDIKLKVLRGEIRNLKSLLNDNEVSLSLLEPIHINNDHKCYGGINEISIYADGTIYPCMMSGGVKGFEIGNVNSGIDINKRDRILGYNNKQYCECLECDIQDSCEGKRCKIINKLLTGSFIKPSALTCELHHISCIENGVK